MSGRQLLTPAGAQHELEAVFEVFGQVVPLKEGEPPGHREVEITAGLALLIAQACLSIVANCGTPPEANRQVAEMWRQSIRDRLFELRPDLF